MTTFGIAEWFGHDFLSLDPTARQRLARVALGSDRSEPCPYRGGTCSKAGGVCSIREYDDDGTGRIDTATAGPMVITCPNRFEQDQMLVHWLAEITGLTEGVKMAREVPFMIARSGKPAGKIDLVVATDNQELRWFGLEVQAVYFSGDAMAPEFRHLQTDEETTPPYPQGRRHPDWRSSTAKRLMPQLQAKVPTLRRWASRIAVAVDAVLFEEAMGGASTNPSHDVDSGDVIWLVSELRDGELRRRHWEVLTLEESCDRLLAAHPIGRVDFETHLRSMLRAIPTGTMHD
ncbi:MAG: hypothetical protein F4209_10875 [Chloroflexi bacterium]|nr:hypothetical protein [Chloroflexota bacterium]MYF23223.1 hypothetical protein [Chloroflexota bacterium]